jgi:hypothetical protein
LLIRFRLQGPAYGKPAGGIEPVSLYNVNGELRELWEITDAQKQLQNSDS